MANFNELKVKDKNTISAYLPIRNKGNDFSWDNVAGRVLSTVLGKEVNQTLEEFEVKCKERFLEIADERLWNLVAEAYFRNEILYKLHPQFTLMKATHVHGKPGMVANQRLAAVFNELLQGKTYDVHGEHGHNFVESELMSQITAANKVANSPPQPYLPFLAEAFQRDINFLTSEPDFMMAELANVLRFYAFTYCAQLALNLDAWKELPKARPLFFILADEKASSERVQVKHYGHKYLRTSLLKVFPWLAMSQQLQTGDHPVPLWHFYQRVLETDSSEDLVALQSFIVAFADNRQLKLVDPEPTSLDAAFDTVFSLTKRQFEDQKFTRHEINDKYVGECEARILADFVQTRGRAGKVLVITHEQLLLLTNLVVGKSDRLWFTDLVEGLRARGIFFDRQSQSALIAFYERVGNVERKSDSGDAIYVRKTL